MRELGVKRGKKGAKKHGQKDKVVIHHTLTRTLDTLSKPLVPFGLDLCHG